MTGLHHDSEFVAVEAALGSVDSKVREAGLARMLGAVASGVFDDELATLGDRMASALDAPQPTRGDDTVFARSFSVLVLAACVDRDRSASILQQDDAVRGWCRSLCRWYPSERDDRGFVPGMGWAHAVAHGADAVAAFARSPRITDAERSELAAALADRALAPGAGWTHGEADRVALALDALPAQRDDVIDSLGSALRAVPADADADPYRLTFNADQLLRALALRSDPGSGSDHRIRSLLARAHPYLDLAPQRGLHHIEIWVADIGIAARSWGWLLERLGYELTAQWTEGRTWSGGGAYLTLTTSPNLSAPDHDRRRPGVNHLAFWGGAPAEVDAVMAQAPGYGWTPLYADRYPHAGGPDHYAGWLENSEGFKIEIVAGEHG